MQLIIGKGKTALSMSLQNPQFEEQYYYEGHYMTYQRFTSDGSRWYNEGRILQNQGVRSDEQAYKIQRNLSQNNNWCGYVNNIAAYCITTVRSLIFDL